MPHALRGLTTYVVALLGLLPVAADAVPNVWTEQHVFRLGRSGTRYTLVEEVVVRVTVGTEHPERAGTFVVAEPFYAPLQAFEARLDGRPFPRGAVREERPELADVFLSGARFRVAELPDDPAPGSVVEYRYRRTFTDVAYAPVLYVAAEGRLDRFEVRVAHPEYVAVGFDVFHPRGEVSAVEDRAQPGVTRLTFGALDAAPDLPLFPYNGFHAAVRLRLDSPAGPVNPHDADGFAAWYGALTGDASGEPSPGVAALAATLQGATPEATVAALHDYVRGTVRYIADERGEHAFVPRVPDVVLERRYGDCKDRAFLVASLARALGLRVDVVLVGTRPAPVFEGPHLSSFDHAINAFTHADGRRTYFDPTHRHAPFGDLPAADVAAYALRMGADGAEVLRLPDPAGVATAPPAFDLAVHADLGRPAEGTATLTLRGDLLAVFREAEARGSALDLRNAVAAVANATLFKIGLDAFEVVADSGRAVTLTATADLSEFIVASPTRRYVPHAPFRGVPPEAVERAGDAYPVWTELYPDARLTLELAAEGFTAEPAAVAHGAGGGPARFTAALEPLSGGARVVYDLRQAGRYYTGAERDAYLDFARGYLGARRDMFVFRPAEGSSAGPAAGG